MSLRTILSAIILGATASTLCSVSDPELNKLKPFLKQHCYQCHGPEKQKNDIRLDTLGTDLSDHNTLEIWQGVLDQLNLGEMPPENKPQPTKDAASQVVGTLTTRLKAAYAQKRSTGAKAVIRRLNRHELRNTLRDLLHLQGAAYRPGAVSKLIDNNGNGRVERKGNDPVRLFPEDEKEEGFSNIGDRLVMSDFLLKLTLGAVEETLQAATHTEAKPSTEVRKFGAHIVSGKQYGQQTVETVSREYNPDFDMLALGYQRFGRLSPNELRGGVRTSARYRITVEASAHNRDNPWKDMLKLDSEHPFQLSLNIGDTANGGIAGPTSTQLAKWDIPSNGKRHTFSFESWIDDTWTPWVGWENGPYDRAFRAEAIVQKYYPDNYTPRPDKKKVEKAIYDAWPIDMARILVKDGYKGPHIRIYSIKLEPLIPTWPPTSHTALYGRDPPAKANVEALLLDFAQRAFRRPIKADEVSKYVQLVHRLLEENKARSGGTIEDLTFKSYLGKWDKLPDFEQLKPVRKGTLAEGLVDIRPAQAKEYFGLVFEGNLKVEKAGEYEIHMASDDGARVRINGKTIVEHDGLHGPSPRKGKIHLESGKHKIRVEYFAYGQPNSLKLGWSGPGFGITPLSIDKNAPKQMVATNSNDVKAIKALQAGYTAMLCSPRFLYLQEPEGELDDYAIASRLSYFLWSSMPDDQLFELANKGRLREKKVLRQQVERMLKDPRADSFIRNFTVTWLRLDKLGKMPPEKGGPFRFYHDRKMEPMFVDQAVTFVKDILQTNKSIRLFIDSDYTYMNEAIASWIYQRKDINGDTLRKVKLDDPRRGGLFTQPGVMTATSNGVDTTPILRGVWLLENVLGTPPSPPPPDVEPLAPDLRDAKTIREQLELHRKNEACNSCHRKIDPMGFAFESFDPVGRWRTHYPKPRLEIDPSTTLSNGDEIPDIVAFKQMLLKREDDVARCLVKKMLTYATGRILEPIDRGETDRIATELAKKGNRLRELVHLVATSEIFLNK